MVALPGNAYDFKVIITLTLALLPDHHSLSFCQWGKLQCWTTTCRGKYMSPVEEFATGIKIFDCQKLCLITQSLPSEALDLQWFKDQIGNHTFLLLLIFAVTLILWLAAHLIPFWYWSKILHQGTYKWLPLKLTIQCWDSDPLAHLHHV